MTITRCKWAKSSYEIDYHDNEWGFPSYDDRYLFELLSLEGAQAGLSWNLILTKRQGYIELFKNFDINKVANMTDTEVSKLYNNSKIIRNKLKINSVISNAKSIINIQKKHGSFAKFIWGINNNKIVDNAWDEDTIIPATSELSEKLSITLKKQGFKFVGPTICYSYLQAIGMINDHNKCCFIRENSNK